MQLTCTECRAKLTITRRRYVAKLAACQHLYGLEAAPQQVMRHIRRENGWLAGKDGRLSCMACRYDVRQEFHCPVCRDAGHQFGTVYDTGHCGTTGCSFTWPRSEDWRYFITEVPQQKEP